MEQGKYLSKPANFTFNAVKSLRLAKKSSFDARYGTLEQRREAYGRLYTLCEGLFMAHATHVGILHQPGPERSQRHRLLFEGYPGVDEIIIDSILPEETYSISVKNHNWSPKGTYEIDDTVTYIVTPDDGLIQIAHQETHYPPNYRPNEDKPVFLDTIKEDQPLAANAAINLATRLTSGSPLIISNMRMANATYPYNN